MTCTVASYGDLYFSNMTCTLVRDLVLLLRLYLYYKFYAYYDTIVAFDLVFWTLRSSHAQLFEVQCLLLL